MALWLMEQSKDPNSNWRHWIDALPQSYETFPIFFTDKEIEYLEGSPLKNQVIERREKLHENFTFVENAIPEFGQQFSLE